MQSESMTISTLLRVEKNENMSMLS